MSKNQKKVSLNFYKQWQREKNICPAFNEKVIISGKGWNHIVGNKNKKKRAWNDTYRRLKLLPHAREIINKSTTIQNIKNQNGKVYFALEAMRLIEIKDNKEWRKVRVILEQDKKLRKVFLSVMDKKQDNKNK